MKREQLRKQLIDVLNEIRPLVPQTHFYGFGSFFQGEGQFHDIDVLAVCGDLRELTCLQRIFGEVGANPLVHLTVMLAEEERETDFITRQGCCELVELS